MYHPLLDDPTLLKDQDLELKILDLSKKYHIAARMGQGSACQQIIIALNMYREEQSRRQYELIQRTIAKQNKGLGDLINVE